MFRRWLLLTGVLAVIALVALSPDPVAAAEGAKPVVAQRQWTYTNPMGQSLRWLWSEQVQKELELVDEQKEKLKKIREESTAKMRDMYKQLRDKTGEGRQKKYYELAKQLGEETEKKVRGVLLAHQRDRLKQIVLQSRLRGYGTSHALTSGELAEKLDITDEQKERIRKAQAEAQKKLQEKIREFYRKAYEEAREEVMKELTDKQRKQIKEMMGEKFEWQWQRGAWGQGGATRAKVGTKKPDAKKKD